MTCITLHPKVEFDEPVCDQCVAQLHAEGKLNDAHAALSKAFCTAKMRETVAWARELLGGNGITTDYNVARFFADSEALRSTVATAPLIHKPFQPAELAAAVRSILEVPASAGARTTGISMDDNEKG